MKSRISSGLLLLFIGVQLAYSKGSPDLIVITGGGLIHQIDITDPATLKEFDPWQGQFADWQKKALVDAPCFRRSFEVLFYMSWPERKSSSDHPDLGHGDLKMIYATRYCSTGSTGYVYLPGPSEALYRDNAGTIMRGDADGKWHPSTAAWDALLGNAVVTRDQEASADMIVVSGGELRHPVEITDRESITKLDPWTGPFVDWDLPPRMGHCNWEYDVQYFKRGIEHPTPYDRGDLRMIYGVRYCLGDDGEPGYVQLAGPTERFGPENVRSVWDGTHAGKWHRSTMAWKGFVRRAVESQYAASSTR
ncbi:MAG: hypothetical protein DMG80_16610 [Acidobacteria bacterium]|nr:MAG: hypothetical protein DMG80_16610 [Acidobacteriota bacterium]